MSQLTFDFPLGWQIGLPVMLLALAFACWSDWRRGVPHARIVGLLSLRGLALLLLVFLVSRPVLVTRENPDAEGRPVVLLVDKSESMSLEGPDGTRFQQVFGFVRDQLAPALKKNALDTRLLVFAEETEAVTGSQLAETTPNGKRTNLGRAISRALVHTAQPPRAIIALTDGASTDASDNAKALAGLVEARVPFIGVGFGDEEGARTLTLRQAEAPPTAAPNQAFHISAQLEMANIEELPAFDLLLLRDGQLHDKKTVQAGRGSRFWLENFRVTEKEQGAHTYTIQLVPPASPGLVCAGATATTSVRITDEKELRVLYVQGALTWDYKFINLALRNDPSIKITGLTRTSAHSVFRQNVESAGELVGGFPTRLDEMAPYRVVVLASLRPSDLTPPQQELLARFCGELGGGVLMIGGPSTFDASWQGSRLEQLLPVIFSSGSGLSALDRPFRLQFTEQALQHPVFQVDATDRAALDKLPTFTQYGRVDAAKPSAQIWATHQSEEGPNGKRILMASQRFGAGISAVICVQNFWRWRLARDADTQQFDRFWRQFFRFLSESSRQDVAIHFAEQELRPRSDVQLILERQAAPQNPLQNQAKFSLRVMDGARKPVFEQEIELAPARPLAITFPAGDAGVYTVTVLDANRAPVATRPLEIKELNLEFQNTARNMEMLRQWASLSDGLAIKVEDCRDSTALLEQIETKMEQARRNQVTRRPVGLNVWTLLGLLGVLGGEWLLRKRWGLI
jgi:uncharacterized membrane protein